MFGWRVNWKIAAFGFASLFSWVFAIAGAYVGLFLIVSVLLVLPVVEFYKQQMKRVESCEFPIHRGVPANCTPIDGESLNMNAVTKSGLFVTVGIFALGALFLELATSPIESMLLKLVIAFPLVVGIYSLMNCRAVLFEEGITYRSPGHLFGMWFVSFKDVRSVELFESDNRGTKSLSLKLKSGDELRLNSVRRVAGDTTATDWLGMVEARITPE
jgi:hypothetical protein